MKATKSETVSWPSTLCAVWNLVLHALDSTKKILALAWLHTNFTACRTEFQRAYVGSSNDQQREGDSGSDVQRIEVKQSVRTAILECRLTLTWTS